MRRMGSVCILSSIRIISAKIDPLLSVYRSGIHTNSWKMAQRKVNVSGININIEQIGDGSHAFLCLPGALGCIEADFGPLLPKFTKNKFTVVAWDPPGFGKSRPPNRDFSGGTQYFHRDAVSANELMKTLGFPQYSLLGWSDGANTACVVAAKFPDAVKKLVIWGGNSYISDEDMKLYKQVENLDNWSDRMKAPLIKVYGEEYFRKSWAEWNALFATLHKNGGDIFKNELPRIQCPTFIIHGMKDVMVPFFHAEYFNKHIKNSRLHVMPDGKHNLHLKYADEFVKLAEEFLEE
ncbi:unnamed protein product [Orchesella dallaii]|uniref:AB hydrolase-1 domain-containing protein n=1 Tax=Orchesella dallaii TaxID=48710 RepID=A0ABP1PJW8_9HEXA